MNCLPFVVSTSETPRQKLQLTRSLTGKFEIDATFIITLEYQELSRCNVGKQVYGITRIEVIKLKRYVAIKPYLQVTFEFAQGLYPKKSSGSKMLQN